MNKRKELFFKRLRDYAGDCNKAMFGAINEFELYLEYCEAEVESQNIKQTQPQDEVILYLSDETTGAMQMMDLLQSKSIKEVMPESVSSITNIYHYGGDDMRYLTKRSDGRWCARRTINGKRVCFYGKTQAEALEKMKTQDKNKATKNPKNQPLNTFAFWWLETYKRGNITLETYKNYTYTLNAHIGPISTPLNKVTTVQLQEVLNKLPASRIRKEVYKLLRQIFKKAYELDFIKKDVSEFLQVGKIVQSSRDSLTLDEQKRLVAALGDDIFSRRILFYLCTGARPSEIKTIVKDEIKDGWIKINGSKTNNAVRWVKVSIKLSTQLKNESARFFDFDIKRFRQKLQAFCVKNQICENIDIYRLRHTFATNLYILRVPEKDRQSYMGHAAASAITNAVYTTFSPDTKPEDIYNIYRDLLPQF